MRNVLVTGGTRGLGLGIAKALAATDFHVIAVARKEGDQLAAAQAEIAERGIGSLHFVSFDLSRVGAMAGFVKDLTREFGHFYGLVNNAGLGTTDMLANMADDAIEQLVRLNTVSPITLTKYVLRSIMTGQGGRIVNISSIVSHTGYSGLSVYSATKASLLGFTRSLAREVGPLGITVNAIAPGFVATEMTHEMSEVQRAQVVRRSALKRMPETADIANAVDYLFSEKARNITGTTTVIDAGNTA
ncbi:MAG TPA: SDR family NAD(P)-dependent oxidoreductase [Stellaceae bacterium]|jgi:3-oxoacyl-[acyl-carrier protein] reductase